MEAASAPARTRPGLRGGLLRAAPDERLVARVRRGDERAFEEIYDRYHRPLLGFCRHMLGEQTEAEDVLQHTFVGAYRVLRDPAREIHLKPFLYAIARNRCLSVLRARREKVSIEDVEPSVEGLAAEVQHRADLRELLGDMRRLPEDQREALVLSELGDLSHDDIGEVLGVKREKVKALVFQARENLIGWREARATPCRVIREELATLRGGALRRSHIRRHLDECPECTAFRAEVARQRAAMAALLPVAPGVALKGSVLTAALGGGSVAAAAGAGTIAAGSATVAAKGLAAKILLAAALAGGAGAGGYALVEGTDLGIGLGDSDKPARQATPRGGAVAPGAAPASATAAPTTKLSRRGSSRPSQTPAGSGPAAKATPGVPAEGVGRSHAPGQVKKSGSRRANPRKSAPLGRSHSRRKAKNADARAPPYQPACGHTARARAEEGRPGDHDGPAGGHDHRADAAGRVVLSDPSVGFRDAPVTFRRSSLAWPSSPASSPARWPQSPEPRAVSARRPRRRSGVRG